MVLNSALIIYGMPFKLIAHGIYWMLLGQVGLSVLAPPMQFIQDHFPEDLQWTLLPDPPLVSEFHYSPFKHSAFIKHKIL